MTAPGSRSRQHRAVLLALASSAVAFALWTLARSGGRDVADSSAPRAPAVETEAPRGEPLAPEADASAVAAVASRTAEPLSTSVHTSGGHYRGLVVEVVGADGHPVASAPVLVLRRSRQAPENPFERKVIDAEPTDVDGRALFDLAEIVSGHDAGSVEEVTLGPGLVGAPRKELPRDVADGTTVRLVVAAALLAGHQGTRVRVVDSAGTPVGGVPVDWGSSGPRPRDTCPRSSTTWRRAHATASCA